MFGDVLLGRELFGGSYVPPVRPTPAAFRQPLTDARFGQSLAPQWTSLCTITIIETGTSGSGQRIGSTGEIVQGMDAIPCRLGPIDQQRPLDNERRDPRTLSQYARRILKLSGYYPLIVPRQMQVTVDGVTYAIRGNEADSEKLFTRLHLEYLTPSAGVAVRG